MQRFAALTALLIGLLFTSELPALATAGFPPLTIVSVRSPVSRGGEGAVTIRTAPNTPCVITVTYSSGPSKAVGLRPKTSTSRGAVTWTWRVGTRTTPGVWPIRVECGRDQITRVETEFEVI